MDASKQTNIKAKKKKKKKKKKKQKTKKTPQKQKTWKGQAALGLEPPGVECRRAVIAAPEPDCVFSDPFPK